ncbi:MAG: repressor LexA, partial [Actinobacteria bacterium]|nr:repressor LexA [Actinomycetota bacterium]
MGNSPDNASDTPKDNVVSLPETPAGDDGLTARQRKILDFSSSATADRGYPPSMREIGEAVGLTSSGSVDYQLKILGEKGFITRDANRARALE